MPLASSAILRPYGASVLVGCAYSPGQGPGLIRLRPYGARTLSTMRAEIQSPAHIPTVPKPHSHIYKFANEIV